jgi:WD40 repeat protein
LVFPPPTATPPLPEPTIGPETLAALRPLRVFGMGGARKVAIAPGGKLLAVATTAGVALFELPALRHLRFDPIDGGAWQLAWRPDARQLAVAIRTQADHGSIAVYQVADGAVVATAPGDEPAWSHDGQVLATTRCEQDCRTTLTRTDGTPAVTLAGRAPIFSPDSRTVVTSEHTSGVGGQIQSKTLLWRADGRQLADLSGDYVLDFSSDSQILAIAPFAITAQTEIRSSVDGAVIRAFAGGLPAFSHDGKILALTDGSTVSLWRRQDLDSADVQPLRIFEPPIEQASGYGNALSFSPNDQALRAVLGHHLYSWRVADGTPLGTIADAAAEIVTFEARGAIMSTISAGGDAPPVTSLMRTADGGALYEGQVSDISFGDDNTTIALFTFGGPLQVLGLDGGKGPSLDLPKYTGVTFSPDAQTMALSTHDTVSLWDVVDSTRKQTLGEGLKIPFDDVPIRSMRYSRDGRLLMYEAQRDNIYEGVSASTTVWDVAAGGQPTHTIRSRAVGRSEQAEQRFRWAFSPEGGASAFSYDARHVEIQAGADISVTITTPITVTALAFSPGGAALAIGDAAGAVRLVNPADGSSVRTLQAGGAVRGLFFSPDGALLAALRDDGAAPVWRIGEPAPLATLAGLSRDATLRFTADNQLLLVGSYQSVAFYRLSDGALLSTLPAAAEDIAIGPRKRLLAVLHDGRVMLWGVAPTS